MRFSGFEPKGRLKQQKYGFRRPFFQQGATAIRQKQSTATPMSAAQPDKPPSAAASTPATYTSPTKRDNLPEPAGLPKKPKRVSTPASTLKLRINSQVV